MIQMSKVVLGLSRVKQVVVDDVQGRYKECEMED